uniref:NADH-ubiquinone oxidoreductase chain 2 n=1 Tax=Phoronopsis harmeri TaxID=490051 RepID=J9PPU8_9BILA|nr:NADH dehydrogenase subunit 2 [Phoronopsis harmeri]AES86295.1 NADH dehydrogenase subunit 2 [Phoronopsis harmeri]
MAFLPTISTFFSILCFSIVFCLSSSHWFGVWLGLELNMISFIVLSMSEKSLNSSESAIKYFLLQALGSGLFVLGSCLSYASSGSWLISSLSGPDSLLILSGLGLKLGAAPFHFWVPSVMNSLSWYNALVLSSLQKIAPLLFILVLFPNFSMLFMLILSASGALVGGIGGLNQTQILALLGYSSIGHLGWIMGLSLVSLYFSIFYFLLYLITVTVVFCLLKTFNTNKVKSFSLKEKMNSSMQVPFFICLLSLGGLPPLLGFFPKMVGFKLLSENLFSFLLGLLILGSLMSLFYYLNLFFNSYMSSMSAQKQSEMFLVSNFNSLLSALTVIFCLSGLMFMEIFSF